MMNNTKKITTLGIMGALSVLLVVLIHFPIFPAAPFLEYDPADVPIFVSTFFFGPLLGFLLTVVVSIVQGITVSSSSGFIGIIMHIVSTGSFVVVAGNIYKKNKNKKSAAIALLAGAVTMSVIMILWNVIMTPIFMNVDRKIVLDMLVPTIIPFNLIKSCTNAFITKLIYKKISVFIKK